MTKAKSDEKIVRTPSEPSASELPNTLIAAAREAGKKGPAPVHLWNPPFCGDLDMRIARDGTWFYLGTPIGRHALVQLFSSILRRDGDDYFLVTPVEKVGITVDDAPFVAIDFAVEGEGEAQSITFTTHVGDTVTAGPEAPIRIDFDPDTQEPTPYVLVRANLEALIDRKSFYRLVDLGTSQDVDGKEFFGIWSQGTFFPLIDQKKLG
ncbi:DUF1285 domain-containing protein [Falsihalocynthiibacter sp. SS001]|uniref:DUF1285 domain-containing protein n=1 Tax=Falsihalocynthiibacter sp. SS001 TaxID=3349698 RepID=UPI0036D3CA2F